MVTAFNFSTYDATDPVLYDIVLYSWKYSADSAELVNETATVWEQYFTGNTSVDFGVYWRITGNPVLGEVGTTIEVYMG